MPIYLKYSSQLVSHFLAPKSVVKNDQNLEKTLDNIVCISSLEEFKQLKNDWNDLVEKSVNPHPFLLWEWMFTWWETFQENNKLCILALYKANNLIAIAPFYIKTQTKFLKRLSLIGEGENKEDMIVTTYPDIIVKVGFETESIKALAKYISNEKLHSKKFNYAAFNLVHDKSILQQVGLKLSSNFINSKRHSENQFVIKLPEKEEDYDLSLSKSTRKQFRLKLNRMKKVGDINLSSVEDLTEGLSIVEKLHRARWHSKSEKNAFDSVKFSEFHKVLCERFQNQNILDFRVMRHDGEPIAAAYNFNYKQSCFSYMSGFHSSDDKRYSPMFIFDMLEIKNLITKNYNCYDMLVSESENNYKTKFCSEVNSVYTIHWFRKGIIAVTLLSFMKIKPTLSKIYHKFIK